ncbi:MAG: ATP:cob(I)alamin adenosyltransferase [Candidatus Peregrinibacteria bacterium Gr01-1014_25]|nr:MAG: ATP:cob(I)alamin adenosyltransferase [Candidatus Peregrinibacteria bacterium Gr01-1014_25]
MMSIVTRTGDGGTTGLLGGTRVRKDDPRVHAEGTIDELNALLGVVCAEKRLPQAIHAIIARLQHLLFTVGADLAAPARQATDVPHITAEHIAIIDAWIAAIEPTLPPLTRFILPGGSRPSAQLHHARAVCRRAERWAVALQSRETIGEHVIPFLNRTSDLLFLLAREANRAEATPDIEVEYYRPRQA